MSQDAVWSELYASTLNNTPVEGTILRPLSGAARINVELVDGKPPFLYARAYVPQIVGEPIGWFLADMECEHPYGWKIILLPKAREECIRRLGLNGPLAVKAIRILRESKSGNSLLGEVAEW